MGLLLAKRHQLTAQMKMEYVDILYLTTEVLILGIRAGRNLWKAGMSLDAVLLFRSKSCAAAAAGRSKEDWMRNAKMGINHVRWANFDVHFLSLRCLIATGTSATQRSMNLEKEVNSECAEWEEASKAMGTYAVMLQQLTSHFCS